MDVQGLWTMRWWVLLLRRHRQLHSTPVAVGTPSPVKRDGHVKEDGKHPEDE